MPPRLDMTPYWLIVPVLIGVAVVVVLVVAASFVSRAKHNREDEE